jgi:hypothetical protein
MPTTSAAKTKHGLISRAARPVTPTPISAPLIFVGTNWLKPGQLDAERRVPGLVEFVEHNEPQLIAFNEHVNGNGTEVTVIQVHPDAASMQKHLGIIGQRAAQAYDETLDATIAPRTS